MMQIEDATVVAQEVIATDYRLLRVEAPGISSSAGPGQFVHIRIPDRRDLTLRRPFSIHMAEDGVLSVLYKHVGEGTGSMCRLGPGDELSMMGPLGNGFPSAKGDTLPVLVAGGYGVAPLYMLARALGRKGALFVGGASADDILMTDLFDSLGWEVVVATEDGSIGTQGFVTAALDEWLPGRTGDTTTEFYACGPDGMLRAVADRARSMDADAWLSMDRHMGCGAGACLACVVRLTTEDGTGKWGRVCKDGPVFESREVTWDA